ncbi:DUF2301 domain-containing membrane protein [Halomicronema hongdechloris]
MADRAVPDTVVYEGQFGSFVITEADRRGVIIYRAGLVVAAMAFAIAIGLVSAYGPQPWVWRSLSVLYAVLWLGLGISLATIHIYLQPLHRALQIFWLIGGFASLGVAHGDPRPFLLTVYEQPLTLLGVGFTFAALTGIFFKEAFCFDRLETKFLTPLVPLLLLGHLVGLWPLAWEQALLIAWAMLFVVFALRKVTQAIPPDIGDKSVFEYLKQQRAANS